MSRVGSKEDVMSLKDVSFGPVSLKGRKGNLLQLIDAITGMVEAAIMIAQLTGHLSADVKVGLEAARKALESAKKAIEVLP